MNKWIVYILAIFTLIGGIVHLLMPWYNLITAMGSFGMWIQVIAGLLTIIYVLMAFMKK